jgi:broad specificity phosphatase PhoE
MLYDTFDLYPARCHRMLSGMSYAQPLSLTGARVGHADVIRVALTYSLGMPLYLLLRLEVRPASISIVAMERYRAARSLYQQHGRVG